MSNTVAARRCWRRDVSGSFNFSDFYELNPAIRRISLNLAADSGNALVGLAQNQRRVIALRRELRRFSPDVALGMMTGVNVLYWLWLHGTSRKL
jgi:hypothetical protein